jgi:hypothetical protein
MDRALVAAATATLVPIQMQALAQTLAQVMAQVGLVAIPEQTPSLVHLLGMALALTLPLETAMVPMPAVHLQVVLVLVVALLKELDQTKAVTLREMVLEMTAPEMAVLEMAELEVTEMEVMVQEVMSHRLHRHLASLEDPKEVVQVVTAALRQAICQHPV